MMYVADASTVFGAATIRISNNPVQVFDPGEFVVYVTVKTRSVLQTCHVAAVPEDRVPDEFVHRHSYSATVPASIHCSRWVYAESTSE
jgi:hypothetical protein